MQSKTRELAILYEQTAKQITYSLAIWTGFLGSVNCVVVHDGVNNQNQWRIK